MKPSSKKFKPLSKTKRILFFLFTLILSVILFFFIAEIIFRIIPIPGIYRKLSTYDKDVGKRYYPNSKIVYSNERGDFVLSRINSKGFFDIEHSEKKIENRYRIGFFGDSYTEARQVNLENRFHKIIENGLKNYSVECISFGITGFSTLQSYLNYKKWQNLYELDMIVYVFCNNDLGDQIEQIKGTSKQYPWATLDNDTLKIDYSFRDIHAPHNIIKSIQNFLSSNSFLFSTLLRRTKLLIEEGIKLHVTDEDRLVTLRERNDIKLSKFPYINDPLSSWSDSLTQYAQKLEASVLTKWEDDILKNHQKFVILYIPIAFELEKTSNRDSWKNWLDFFCFEQKIDLIDPTDEMKKTKQLGNEIFYNHLTADGHIVFAKSFMDWFVNINTTIKK